MTKIVPIADINVPTSGSIQTGGVITIGNFDGVHRGHSQLLREVRRQADLKQSPALAVTLYPHPAALLRPESTPPQLTTIAHRAKRMHTLGIDQLVVCETTQALLGNTPEEFFDRLIVDRLEACGIVEGPNFYFGRGRSGDIDTLGKICVEKKITLSVVASLKKGREMVSSTRIRDMLSRGNVHGARELLGRSHEIAGTIESGDGRGRTIGFPTANLSEIDVVVPAPGVYAGWAAIDGGMIKRQAAIHIGESPTFQSGDPGKVEIHLLDFDDDLYGKSLTVEFVDRIRDVSKFESADLLAEQLQRDVQRTRTVLRKHHS